MNLTQLREELISVESEMNKLKATAGEENFDFEQWGKLETQREQLKTDIDTIQDKAIQDAKEAAANFKLDNPSQSVQEPIVKDNESQHVYLTQRAKELESKMGYECAGELLADAIAYAQFGSTVGDGAKYKNERFGNYLQNTDSLRIEQAAGTASTLDDGIEIIPTLLPGIKERGPGTFRPIIDMFRPERTARKEIDYYLNEDVYNRDGLITARVDEGGTLTPQKFTNKLERMRIFKVGVFASITEEDLQNVPLLESRYMRRAPEVIEIQKVDDIIRGDGVSKPIGFTTADNGARILVNRTTTSEIVFADLANMEKQYWRGGGGSNGMYFTNQSTLAQLMSLQDPSGALIWKASRNDGLLGGPIHGTLFGRPLLVSEDMPALGAIGDLSLVNPEGYLFAEHTSGTRFAESMHFFFNADKSALRWLSQYGGRPVFTKPYSPREGGEDLSHFILLNNN